jgi:hypothetical protein
MLNSFIRSTTILSEVFKWMYHEDGGGGGGGGRVRLEKRMRPNVDFNDALQVLDSTQILSNLGLV